MWERELYPQMVFFVQTILADRYIHRREMWVVSLKSSSSIKFEIKTIKVSLLSKVKGKFTVKKIRILFELFFKKIFIIFFCFFKSPRD